MGKSLIITLFSVFIIGVIGILIVKGGNGKNPSNPTLYYSLTCPHCKEVDDFIRTHDIKNKFSFSEKEISNNRTNALELAKNAKKCGIVGDSVSIPLLFAENKCYVGSTEIITYLSQKANIIDSSPTATYSGQMKTL